MERLKQLLNELPYFDLQSTTRKADIILIKMAYCYLANEMGYGPTMIAKSLKRTHAAAYNLITKAKWQVKYKDEKLISIINNYKISKNEDCIL